MATQCDRPRADSDLSSTGKGDAKAARQIVAAVAVMLLAFAAGISCRWMMIALITGIFGRTLYLRPCADRHADANSANLKSVCHSQGILSPSSKQVCSSLRSCESPEVVRPLFSPSKKRPPALDLSEPALFLQTVLAEASSSPAFLTSPTNTGQHVLTSKELGKALADTPNRLEVQRRRCQSAAEALREALAQSPLAESKVVCSTIGGKQLVTKVMPSESLLTASSMGKWPLRSPLPDRADGMRLRTSIAAL